MGALFVQVAWGWQILNRSCPVSRKFTMLIISRHDLKNFVRK